MKIIITVKKDLEAEVWVASSTNDIGLVMEDKNLYQLCDKVNERLIELSKLNGFNLDEVVFAIAK